MGKYANTDVLDGALNIVKLNATTMIAMSGQPATYAAATAGKLCETPMTTADFTLAAGDISGRKVTVGAKSGLAVEAAGTADHVALLDPTNSRLLYVTTCPAQALPIGGTVSFAPWSVEVNNPV